MLQGNSADENAVWPSGGGCVLREGMNFWLLLFAGLLAGKLAAELWLDALNRRHARRMAGAVPEAFRGFMNDETYKKSAEYTLAKNRFGAIETVYDAAVLAAVVLTGFLPWLYEFFTGLFGGYGTRGWAQALVLFFTGTALALPGLPFEWWGQFRLEERFGFNKSTLKLWITDKLKGLVLGAALGVPLLWALLGLAGKPGWWLWAFSLFFIFQIVMMIVYPMFIMPWFNKFEPLPDAELRKRLMRLAERAGFRARAVLVMDGSKRSGHSNAFFTGFGKFRRIVLFDTLMEQLAPEELEAVLAHEIGHYKLGHVWKMLAASSLFMLLGFWALGQLTASERFVSSFGFEYTPGLAAPAILLFGLLSGLAAFWLAPVFNFFLRKNEYAADIFARQAVGGNPAPLIQALRALHEKNLSNLTPHPAYSAFHYSHPALLERETALREQTG